MAEPGRSVTSNSTGRPTIVPFFQSSVDIRRPGMIKRRPAGVNLVPAKVPGTADAGLYLPALTSHTLMAPELMRAPARELPSGENVSAWNDPAPSKTASVLAVVESITAARPFR